MTNTTCSADECTLPIQRREWCNTHYRRMLKAGPLPVRQGTCQDCAGAFDAPGTGVIAPRCRPCAAQHVKGYFREKHQRTYTPVAQRRDCTDCGASYDAPGRDTNSRRCPPCRIAEKRRWKSQWAKDNRDKVMTDTKRIQLKAGKHRRRVRQRDAKADRFTAPEIYKRDGWACQICGLVIDPNEKFPSRDSASLDHIIPLALGGTHTLNNVQLACMGCNWAKGARLAA